MVTVESRGIDIRPGAAHVSLAGLPLPPPPRAPSGYVADTIGEVGEGRVCEL